MSNEALTLKLLDQYAVGFVTILEIIINIFSYRRMKGKVKEGVTTVLYNCSIDES